LGADRVNISTSYTVKLAPCVEEPLCTVARNTGTHPGYLLLHTGVMLHTSGDISPGTIILTKGNIVSSKVTHNIAGLTRE